MPVIAAAHLDMSYTKITGSNPAQGIFLLPSVSCKSSIFCDITQCSPLKVNRPFTGTCRLHLQGRRISKARNQHGTGIRQSNQILKMELRCSSETSVTFQRNTRNYIPEDKTFYNHRWGNLKSDIFLSCLWREASTRPILRPWILNKYLKC
jgi:hypothetical protein